MKNHRIHHFYALTATPFGIRQNGYSSVVVLLAVAVVMSLSACSGSSTESAPPIVSEPLLNDSVVSEPVPEVLKQLQDDPTVIAPVPDVAHTQTMADSGLQISYTEKPLTVLAPATLIEQQWVFMQDCVQQVSVAPLVLVREGPAVPFTQADDVVRNETITALEITSIPIASASTLYGPVIQVSVDDFDGSLGTPAFNLRSIMGRHLWLSASLPERDYPFECARQQP